MKEIESLDIVIDVSDRKHFYDFRHSALVQEPRAAQGKLPEGQGISVGGCCRQNDAYQLRTAQIITSHILDKRFFEKFAPTKEGPVASGVFGNDNPVLGQSSLPCYLLPVYQPGEIVRGTVILSLKSKLTAEKLTLNLLGRTTVNVRIHHGRGYYDKTEYQVYMNDTLDLWKASHVKAGDKDRFLLDTDMLEGVHPFPFEFRLPESVNSSILPVIGRDDHYAFNVYRLRVTADRRKLFGRGNAVTCRGIWIDRRVNTANLRDKLSPSVTEKVLRTGGCCSPSEDIKCRATVPRAAFARTDSVPVSVDIDNNSGGPIEEVTAQICLHGRAKTGTMKISIGKSFSHTSVPQKAGPVLKNDSVNYKFILPFDFSQSFLDSCVIPVSEASDLSKLIHFQYEVQVTVNRKRQSKDIKLAIPITVCTESEGDLTAFQ